MKRIFMTFLALTVLGSTSLIAGFQGPGSDEIKESTTVSKAKQSPEGTKVTLTGNLTKQIRNEYYMFKDKTAEINIKIDNDKLKALTVTPKTSITIYGEVELQNRRVYIDVDKILINSTPQQMTSSKESLSVPPPPGSEEVLSGIDNGCNYIRYSINQSLSDVMSYFDNYFRSNGWKVTSKGGGGGSYGGGAGITAKKDGQYAKVSVGGAGSDSFFNIILGHDKRSVDNCRVKDEE